MKTTIILLFFSIFFLNLTSLSASNQTITAQGSCDSPPVSIFTVKHCAKNEAIASLKRRCHGVVVNIETDVSCENHYQYKSCTATAAGECVGSVGWKEINDEN